MVWFFPIQLIMGESVKYCLVLFIEDDDINQKIVDLVASVRLSHKEEHSTVLSPFSKAKTDENKTWGSSN